MQFTLMSTCLQVKSLGIFGRKNIFTSRVFHERMSGFFWSVNFFHFVVMDLLNFSLRSKTILEESASTQIAAEKAQFIFKKPSLKSTK
jgi:hypothetical protein